MELIPHMCVHMYKQRDISQAEQGIANKSATQTPIPAITCMSNQNKVHQALIYAHILVYIVIKPLYGTSSPNRSNESKEHQTLIIPFRVRLRPSGNLSERAGELKNERARENGHSEEKEGIPESTTEENERGATRDSRLRSSLAIIPKQSLPTNYNSQSLPNTRMESII